MQRQFETCSTPDRGYMGDRARGASLGRSNRDSTSTVRRLRADITATEQRIACYSEPSSAYLFSGTSRTQAECIAREQAELLELQKTLPAAERAAANDSPKFHLRRIRLDSGGYDQGGAYWGHGGYLFEAFTADGQEFMTLRIDRGDISAAFEARGGQAAIAAGREQPKTRAGQHALKFLYHWAAYGPRETAKDAVRAEYPGARFYR